MTTVSMDIAQKELPNLIEDVVLGGHVVITRNSLPVAELIPTPHARPRPVFGSAKGQIEIMDNFDDPIKDFDDYLQ